MIRRSLSRLRAASAATRAAESAWRAQLRRRDELVEEAVDAGVSQRKVAEAAGLSRSRVVAIHAVHYAAAAVLADVVVEALRRRRSHD
jgi:hypothetical protein